VADNKIITYICIPMLFLLKTTINTR